MTVGNRMEKIRRSRKRTQNEFALDLGISQSAYQNYEKDIRDIPSSVILELFQKHNVDPVWLLTGKQADLNNEQKNILKKAFSYAKLIAEKKGKTYEPEAEFELVMSIFEILMKNEQTAVGDMIAVAIGE